jgi:hypothetical protein
MATIDEYTLASIPLTLLCRGNPLSTGTGFFHAHAGIHYLVSNWHVFSGRHPDTGQTFQKMGATPDKVRMPVHATQLGQMHIHEFDLCDANGDAFWIQHQRGQEIDVGMLPIAIPQGCQAYELPRTNQQADMIVSVGSDVFVLGFPLGLALQQGLPIWKRASVATEPDILVLNLPVFLIDTATREGMSGSPVIARTNGIYRSATGNVLSPLASKFIGVYSGRYGADDEFAAQLGRVWHERVITEILANPAKGGYTLKRP